jgi:hypothetical protein
LRRVVGLLIALTLLVHGPAGSAQESARCESQTNEIAHALDADARGTRVWYWSWMAAGTALVASQLTLAAFTTGDLQKDSLMGGGSAVFIPAFLLIHPPEVLSDAPKLDDRLARTSVDGRLGDPCVALPRARELLARDAADEGFAKAWFAHAFVIGGNIVLGLVLGVGFGDWLGFAKQAIGGSIVGELQIWTLPGGALQARGLGVGGSF